jgi:hypothetical protein
MPVTGHGADPVSGGAAGRTGAEAAGETWELWRQDDNGNKYLVSVHPDEASARDRMFVFESGTVHKQNYWIQKL